MNTGIRSSDPDVISTLDTHVADVLHAMLLGEYGQRVREHAQAEVGIAWTEQHLQDAGSVLLGVLERLREHMLPIHVGTIAERIVIHLVVGAAADPSAMLTRHDETE